MALDHRYLPYSLAFYQEWVVTGKFPDHHTLASALLVRLFMFYAVVAAPACLRRSVYNTVFGVKNSFCVCL